MSLIPSVSADGISPTVQRTRTSPRTERGSATQIHNNGRNRLHGVIPFSFDQVTHNCSSPHSFQRFFARLCPRQSADHLRRLRFVLRALHRSTRRPLYSSPWVLALQ